MTSTSLPNLPTSSVVHPPQAKGLWAWAKKNLFRTPFDTALTLIVGFIALNGFIGFLQWSISVADWQVITINFRILLQGRYPGEEGGRLALSVFLLLGLAGLSWGLWGRLYLATAITLVVGVVVFVLVPLAQEALAASPEASLGLYLSEQLAPLVAVLRDPIIVLVCLLIGGYLIGRVLKVANKPLFRRLAIISWVIAIPIVFVLVRGFERDAANFPLVAPNLWGGLLLTFMLAFVAIVACFPLGILLAIGRMSGGGKKRVWHPTPFWFINPLEWIKAIGAWWSTLGNYPILKLLSIAYIEFLRGVPLVTVFFTASLIVPLALGDANIDSVVRAMVALTLFEAAYIAEIVRGGLQALPPGQVEAGKALGLSPIRIALFITLPQAIRIVIPTLVGQFITMFKDTSLVAIIGLTDLLGISRAVLSQSAFTGRHREVYVFIAVVYFVFSYGMSYAARQLERSGSGAIRRLK